MQIKPLRQTVFIYAGIFTMVCAILVGVANTAYGLMDLMSALVSVAAFFAGFAIFSVGRVLRRVEK